MNSHQRRKKRRAMPYCWRAIDRLVKEFKPSVLGIDWAHPNGDRTVKFIRNPKPKGKSEFRQLLHGYFPKPKDMSREDFHFMHTSRFPCVQEPIPSRSSKMNFEPALTKSKTPR